MTMYGSISWNARGLAAAACVLEEYGLSCEADVSHLDEEDLGGLTSKLKSLQSKGQRPEDEF